MLKRKIYDYLNEWKKKENKKSLIISGARQIGKTYIVREFAKSYKSFIEINFLENPSLKRIFEGDLNVDTLIMNMNLYFNNSFIPNDTLILFDEAQECAECITSLKFWTLDNRFDVIATGSALGINYNVKTSYPVGYVEYMDMYSLDFEEFLWANGIGEEIINKLHHHFISKEPLPSIFNDKFMDYLKLYMVVGGMPEVVNAYIKNKDLREVDILQRSIYRDYLNDIARYARPEIKLKAENCYKSIPLQLSKNNHKFQYKVVEEKGTSRKFETSVDWLENAFLVKKVYNLNDINYPLEMSAIEDNFRLYPTDIGLLIAYYDFGLKKAILEDKKIDSIPESLILKSTKGGLYEALAADILIKRGYKNIYFYKPTEHLEIEFIIANDDGIIPIEVKAGRKLSKSLDKILNNNKLSYGYKLADQNIGQFEKKITLPLYMLMFI